MRNLEGKLLAVTCVATTSESTKAREEFVVRAKTLAEFSTLLFTVTDSQCY